MCPTSSVVYYGEKQVNEKFEKKKNQVKGVFENPSLDGEVEKNQTITAQSKLTSLQVEEKGDNRDILDKSDVFKENIKPEQCRPSSSKE